MLISPHDHRSTVLTPIIVYEKLIKFPRRSGLTPYDMTGQKISNLPRRKKKERKTACQRPQDCQLPIHIQAIREQNT